MSAVDRGLCEAEIVYEDSLNEAGIPAWIAEDPEIEFTIDERLDNAVAALDQAREEYRKGTPAPGLKLVVVQKAEKASPVPVDD